MSRSGSRRVAPGAVLGLACAAAALATAGDLLMLWVANALRPELALPRAPALALPLGALLGGAGIPLYALGYGAVARLVEPRSRGQALVLRACGLGVGAVGAAIHGLTALAIRAAQRSGAAEAAPIEAVAASGGELVAGWLLVSVLALTASVVVVAAVWPREGALPRWLACLNPALATVLVALPGLPTEWGRSFLVPAAPNVAHVAFFAASLLAARRAAA